MLAVAADTQVPEMLNFAHRLGAQDVEVGDASEKDRPDLVPSELFLHFRNVGDELVMDNLCLFCIIECERQGIGHVRQRQARGKERRHIGAHFHRAAAEEVEHFHVPA